MPRRGNSMAMMIDRPSARLFLITRQRMLRELFVDHLGRVAPDLSVIGCETFADVPKGLADEPTLIAFYCADLDHRLADDIRAATQLGGSVPVAIISDGSDEEILRLAMAVGIKGLISTTMGAAALVHALRVLLADGEFMPSSAVLAAAAGMSGEGRHAAEPATAEGVALSRREMDVLHLLHTGKSNKAIAAALDMQEGTVKVHLRNLMRKFGAHNRVEVVLATSEMIRGAAPATRGSRLADIGTVAA
jgi:two-component system, NarL family, nitrate/nitrite response regulator NarL